MPHSIKLELQGNVLYFEIIGRISTHVDSIARYVMHYLVTYQTMNVLIDLRRADDRPAPAKLFIHVLKYPPRLHLNCALIDLKHNHDFFSLYLKLMRHRGHRIQFFSYPEDAKVWLQTEETGRTARQQRYRLSSGILAKVIDAYGRASNRWLTS